MPNKLSRYCEAVMEACWLLALVTTPLFFNIYSSRVFEPDKITLMRSLALATLAAWLVKLLSEGGPRWDNVPAHKWGPLAAFYRLPLVLPVGGLVLVYLISTLFSVSPHASLFGSYQRLQGMFTTFSYLIFFAAVAANLRRRAQVERLLTTVIITSLPISLYGLLQRYRLDPLPWGGDTVGRITGNMGNAIFLAAYLIMSTLVILGRVVRSFQAILTDDDSKALPANIVRATLYIFILAINLIAIYFSFSRGPWLGLLAGLFFFFVLLALQLRIRALALSIIGLAAALAVFLVLFNIPNGPLERLRQVPGVGRLGQVFETETGTGRVRVLIWEGVVKLMTPHPPIVYPDGGTDQWNALRPLIGYGPEALYVAFNPFYPPDLAQVEARNATPDRSHNETFDALAFTGVLGLAVHFALFVAIFYYGLKWLGLVGTRRRQIVFLALVLGGGVVSAIGFTVWQGPELFGVGLPFGMLIGLIVFLTLYALRGGTEADTPRLESWRAITLISLFAAIVAHFAEIHFGIAIVSTRTHFWIFTALMLVLGFAWPALRESAQKEAAWSKTTSAPAETTARARRRARASGASLSPAWERWTPILIGVGLMTAILITFGYDYFTNPTRTTQIGQILLNSFARLPVTLPTGQTELRPSYGLLGLMLAAWLIGGVLALLEENQSARRPIRWGDLAIGLGLTLGLSGFAWLVLSSHLASIAAAPPQATTAEQLIAQVLDSASRVAGTLTMYYFLLFLLLIGWAVALYRETPPRLVAAVRGQRPPAGRNTALNLVGYLALPLVAVFLSFIFNLQVIHADIIYKTGFQFDNEGRPQLSIPIYKRAIVLSPGEDYYYLFLGRSFLNTTAALTDPTQREQVLVQAENELKIAQRLNPLNPDHTANLARLNRQWAQTLTEPAQQEERAEHIAQANNYYEQALKLSRNSALLWNEWALLTFQLLNDLDGAQAKLDHSFSLDDNYDQTYLIQGDLYAWRAGQTGTPPEQAQDYYQKAIQAYQKGIQVAEAHNTSTANLRINLANVYIATQQVQPAIDEYLRLVQSNDPGITPWQVYHQIAVLYQQLGDIGRAREYAQLALNAAPDASKAEIQQFLDRLQ